MKIAFGLVIGILAGLVLLFGSAWYEALKPDPGVYIPWQKVDFSYLNYKGENSIDSEAFYAIASEREAERCLLFKEVYPEKSLPDLMKLAQNDSNAMFDMFIRSTYPSGVYSGVVGEEALAYLDAAKKKGHVNATLADMIFPLDYAAIHENIKLIEAEYEVITPLATYVKVLLKIAAEEPYEDDLISLKNAGGYYLLMANGVAAEIAATGHADWQILCEAYYNGCTAMYADKIAHNVRCE